MTLSKSQYIRSLQCQKSIWLYKNKPELRVTPDTTQETLFNTGYQVGDLAKKLFPNGVEIEFDSSDFDGMIEKTKEFIDNGTDVIYEATFKEDGIFAMVDILVKNEDAWDIYEVKASTHTKEYHKNDTAIQWYALSKAISLNRAYVIHINNQYVRDGELNIKELFAVDDITDTVLQKQQEIPLQLSSIKELLQGDEPICALGAVTGNQAVQAVRRTFSARRAISPARFCMTLVGASPDSSTMPLKLVILICACLLSSGSLSRALRMRSLMDWSSMTEPAVRRS